MKQVKEKCNETNRYQKHKTMVHITSSTSHYEYDEQVAYP